MGEYIPILFVAGVAVGVAILLAQLRLFKISDTLDEILQELRRRPGGPSEINEGPSNGVGQVPEGLQGKVVAFAIVALLAFLTFVAARMFNLF